jgi:hypothetical protein
MEEELLFSSQIINKIDNNLNLISQSLKELQEYYFKIGSKKENKNLINQA